MQESLRETQLEETAMRLRTALGLSVAFALIIPCAASSKPPAHAPAHGYRAKQAPKAPAPAKGGVEVIFDNELGLHIAVGVPGVFVHDGRYYREQDGRWQVSLRGDGGWAFTASSGVPEIIVKSKKRHPGPAKAKAKKRK
jgi:hypothetical protein